MIIAAVHTALCRAESLKLDPTKPEQFQAEIIKAYKAGEKSIEIPAGVYKISTASAYPHLQFTDMKNLEVDARGVTFVFTGRGQGGIQFKNCRNVKFSGAILQKETLPFTQGVIDAVAADKKSYDFKVDKGYPTDFDNPRFFDAAAFGSLFDSKTRWWKSGATDVGGVRTERLAPDRFRLHQQGPLSPAQLPAVGDLVAFRGRGDQMLILSNCSKVEIRDVTINSSGGFAIYESDGEGPNYYSVTVKRGPRPAGADVDPLLSSTADGFHSARMRQGPLLENCYFEATHDDAIAIHGGYSLVLQAKSSTLIISTNPYNLNTFRQNDPLRLFDSFGNLVGEAIVKDIQPIATFRTDKKSRRATRVDMMAGPYFQLTLDRELPADFDYFVSNPNGCGRGYIIRNNTIRNHRARGMLLKADDGLVENNTIDGSTHGGIIITPEFWWNEACYSRNVVIRKNTIRNVAYLDHPWAAMVVAAIDKNPIASGGHRNITIEDNTFDSLNGTNLFISSAIGVKVTRNRFVNPQRLNVALMNSSWGVEDGSLAFVTQSEDVQFEGNVVIGRGPLTKKLVQITPSSKVKGTTTGISVQRR